MGDRKRKSLPDAEHVRIAYYGINGSGKTTDLADMARMGTVVGINGEQGFRKRRLLQLGIPVDNIEIAISESDSDLPGASFESLDKLFWELKAELADDPTSVFGLIWDTGTDSQKVMIDQTRQTERERAVRKATREHTEYDQAQMFVDIGWYGIHSQEMGKVLRQFRDLPCSWAIACQEERRDAVAGKPPSIGPALTPSVQGDLMSYSDYVCRLSTAIDEETDETIYLGTFRTEGIAVAKDRDHVMPKPMVQPTFTRVYQYATGQLTAEEDALQQEFLEARGSGKIDESGRPKRRRASEERAATGGRSS